MFHRHFVSDIAEEESAAPDTLPKTGAIASLMANVTLNIFEKKTDFTIEVQKSTNYGEDVQLEVGLDEYNEAIAAF